MREREKYISQIDCALKKVCWDGKKGDSNLGWVAGCSTNFVTFLKD